MSGIEAGEQAIELLWQEFHERHLSDPTLSVHVFAKEHPEHADEMLQMFPLMMELDDLAAETGNSVPLERMPERVAGYPIIRQIGVGGMGLVYEAHCQSLRERIAIKVIASDRLDTKGIQRFELEARAVASLHHTNIVPIYEFGRTEDHYYYTMRLIEGPNLSMIVRAAGIDCSESALGDSGGESSDSFSSEIMVHARNALAGIAGNWERIADLGAQAASALAHAHDNNVLHRDIKPANLLIDHAGKLWITDFGLAKRTLDDDSLTSMYQAVGTPRYMAPEQLHGESDCRSDLFSLGLSLIELVTLKKMNSRKRERLLGDGPGSLKRVAPDVPPELQRILLKSIAPDPEQRYQTAADMATDLRLFAQSRAQSARSKFSSTRLPWIALLLTALVAWVLTNVPRIDPSTTRQTDSGAIVSPTHSTANATVPDATFHVPEGTTVIGTLPEDFGPLDSLSLQGDDRTNFQLDPQRRLLSFVQTPNYEVPVDRDMNNVYTVRLGNRNIEINVDNTNEAPSIDEFVFEPDGRTIVLSQSQLTNAWALKIDDDQDSTYDGLCTTLTGGADQDMVKLTPQGVFVFDPRMRDPDPVDANGDGVYELQLTVSDRTQVCMARLQQRPDGRLDLMKDRIVAGAGIDRQSLVANCLIRRDVVDMATADGRIFYHIHDDHQGTMALFRSTLNDRFELTSELLNDDCGIDRSAIGFATADGTTFRYLGRQRGSTQGVSLGIATLDADGRFDCRLLSEDCGLSYAIEGFSWLDTVRFQHVRRQPDGNRGLYLSFLSGDYFASMRLNDDQSHFTNPCRGQAAWIERASDSQSITRIIHLRIVP